MAAGLNVIGDEVVAEKLLSKCTAARCDCTPEH